MRLVDIYDCSAVGEHTAFRILQERPLEHGISHTRMPNWREHLAFMHQHPRPFRFWFLIFTEDIMDPMLPERVVGTIECLPTNEFGVHILKRFQGLGYGERAVRQFIQSYPPLPALPAIRNGRWLANVAPANKRAAEFFQKLGFNKIQETYAL